MRSRTLPIFVLVIFLIGLLPTAIAQQETGGNTGPEDTTTAEPPIKEPPSDLRSSPTAIAKRPPDVTAKLKERLQERLAKLPEPARLRWEEVNQKRIETLAKIGELKERPEFEKFKKELNFKVRELNTEKLRIAAQNYGQAVKQLVQVREKSKEAHEAFLDTKKQLKVCTENCGEIETQILQNAKEFLLKTADSMIAQLEKIKSRIESNEDLTDEEATEMMTKIDAQIKELEDAKAKAEAATTKEELKEASKTILSAWKRIRNHADWYVGKLAISKHGGVIVKLKHLELRLQKVLEKMEENGKDTSTIQPLVDEFNTNVEEAKKNFELATAKLLEFRNLPEPKGEAGSKLIQEAQGYMKRSKEHLKLAQQKLKEIVKAIKEAKGDEELTTTTTEEALEEADTETGAQ